MENNKPVTKNRGKREIIMATLEQVEKLRERANVTYDEAKAALEATGDNLLEALIYLEKQGKVAPPENGGFYSSRQEKASAQQDGGADGGNASRGESFGQLMRRLWNWLRKLLRAGNTNLFEVWQGGGVLLSVPVTILILLLICGFWVVIPLLLIGLFCGCKYRFRGRDIEKTAVNGVMESAARAADHIKQEVIRPDENTDEKDPL